MENSSLNDAMKRYAKEALRVSFVAQQNEVGSQQSKFKLEQVLLPLKDDLLNCVSMIGRSNTLMESLIPKQARQMKGQLKVVRDTWCNWCSIIFTPPTKKCILQGNVLKVEGSDEVAYYCFNATPFQLQLYSTSFKLYLEDRSDLDVYFECNNPEELRQWHERIIEALNESTACKENLTQTLQDPWLLKVYQGATQKQFVLESEFCEQCQTGDILLFTGKHFAGSAQRFATRSDYDHVGVVIKDESGNIRVFESTSVNGVSTMRWAENLIRYKWYEGIARIAWRRLRVERTRQMLSNLDCFLQSQMNKSFGIRIIELLVINNSVVPTGASLDPLEHELYKEPETYFCSQLVARLYKSLGLIDPLKSSKNYWPRDFSDAGKLEILQGGSLENERVIIFDEQLLRCDYPYF